MSAERTWTGCVRNSIDCADRPRVLRLELWWHLHTLHDVSRRVASSESERRGRGRLAPAMRTWIAQFECCHQAGEQPPPPPPHDEGKASCPQGAWRCRRQHAQQGPGLGWGRRLTIKLCIKKPRRPPHARTRHRGGERHGQTRRKVRKKNARANLQACSVRRCGAYVLELSWGVLC